MITFEAGNVVLQDNGRIWRLKERSVDNHGRGRWYVELVEKPPFDERPIGDVAYVSEDWLNAHCVDHSTAIEPPKGNGVQVCMIRDSELPFRLFGTAEECIDYFTETLTDDDVGLWFGWQADDPSTPDMTCTLVDGELVWSEP